MPNYYDSSEYINGTIMTLRFLVSVPWKALKLFSSLSRVEMPFLTSSSHGNLLTWIATCWATSWIITLLGSLLVGTSMSIEQLYLHIEPRSVSLPNYNQPCSFTATAPPLLPGNGSVDGQRTNRSSQAKNMPQ